MGWEFDGSYTPDVDVAQAPAPAPAPAPAAPASAPSSSGVFGDWDWSKIMKPVAQGVVQGAIPAGVSLLGLNAVKKANTTASNQAAAGATAATGTIAANSNAARASLAEMKARGLDTGAPGTAYMRSVVARNPYQLTPEQKQLVDNQRQQMINGMDPSIRGSGVAYTAAAGQMANNLEVPLINQNLARGDQAASTLHAGGQNAANTADTGSANISVGQGTQVAGIQQNAANTQANATTASGGAQADTMGAIGSFFANAANQASRESRYGKTSYNG